MKRSTSNEADLDPNHLEVTLQDESGEVDLELRLNEDLISPNFHLVVRGNGGEVEQDIPFLPKRGCFYTGHAKGVEQSAVALSNCDGHGYTGVLIEGASTHLIRPLTSYANKKPSHLDNTLTTDDIINKNQSRIKRAADLTPDGLHIIHSKNDQSKCGITETRAMLAPSIVVELAAINNTSNPGRAKRDTRFLSPMGLPVKEKLQAPGSYKVETAVFVDDSMYKFMVGKQGSDKVVDAITNVVLAIMNGVHVLYKSPTMKTDIAITLVRLDIIKSTGGPDKSGGEVEEYLINFCYWQRKEGNKLSSSQQWDHALMITGIDLYDGVPSRKEVIGLAWVSGMCRELYSCTINEGTSFEAVYVITHEMGHNLGMSHDGSDTKKNNCPDNIHIMSPSTGPGKVTWSSCSNSEVETFLTTNRDLLTCLRTTSRNSKAMNLSPTNQMPGEIYTVATQCSFALGDKFKPYITSTSPYEDVCRELWCANTTHAVRTHPALQGSKCNTDMYCMSGKCVSRSGTSSSSNTQISTNTATDDTMNDVDTTNTKKPTKKKKQPRDVEFSDLFKRIRDMFKRYMFLESGEEEVTALPQWWLVNLTECSSLCGGGWTSGTVMCSTGHDLPSLPEENCKTMPKPPILSTCNTFPCVKSS